MSKPLDPPAVWITLDESKPASDPRPQAWSPREVALLRRRRREGYTLARIATELGRSPESVKAYATKHRIGQRAKWTEREKQFVRDHHATMTAGQIAAAIGRSKNQIHAAVQRLGLNRRLCPHGAALKQYAIERHADGWSDQEIADGWSAQHPDRVPLGRHTIGELRRRLGLASNRLHEHQRERVRRNTAEQLRKAGLPSIGHLRVEAFKKFARERGWPEGLGPREVQILDALWQHGPQTRRELAERIGAPWKGTRKTLVGNKPGGSYLAILMRAGLVVKLPLRIYQGRRGSSYCVYSLPLSVAPNRVDQSQSTGGF